MTLSQRSLMRLLGLGWLAPLAFAACGGQADGGAGHGAGAASGGSAQTSSGGVGSTIESGGTPSNGGANVDGGATSYAGAPTGGGSGCCFAIATCDPGDQAISGPSACAAGDPNCYSRSICCSTIWCRRPTCNALPACDPGDLPIMGSCPPNLACYTRTLCGTTLQCRLAPNAGAGGTSGTGGTSGAGGTSGGSAGAAGAIGVAGAAGEPGGAPSCDPVSEYTRKYVIQGTCAALSVPCPMNTAPFFNECGCGCEEDPNCPPTVDCIPGGVPSPYCFDPSYCPFSTHAL